MGRLRIGCRGCPMVAPLEQTSALRYSRPAMGGMQCRNEFARD